jgi:hypothetical protein
LPKVFARTGTAERRGGGSIPRMSDRKFEHKRQEARPSLREASDQRIFLDKPAHQAATGGKPKLGHGRRSNHNLLQRLIVLRC